MGHPKTFLQWNKSGIPHITWLSYGKHEVPRGIPREPTLFTVEYFINPNEYVISCAIKTPVGCFSPHGIVGYSIS